MMSTGIMMRLAFSRPLFTPMPTMKYVMNMKMSVNRIASGPAEMNSVK